MVTIAGVVFSMTLAALSLASSQLGPRLLRNFMRDTTDQAVLGTFVATFAYCLPILRTIRRAEEVAFVPHLSVTAGVLFGLASLGVLIYFIHHLSLSIQADVVVARVGTELVEGIDRLFPDRSVSAGPPPAVAPSDAGGPWRSTRRPDRSARPGQAAGDGLARRELPSANRHDGQGLLRVIASPVTFPEVLDAAFNRIRQYARTSASVTIRPLETIVVIAGAAHRPEDRAARRALREPGEIRD